MCVCEGERSIAALPIKDGCRSEKLELEKHLGEREGGRVAVVSIIWLGRVENDRI